MVVVGQEDRNEPMKGACGDDGDGRSGWQDGLEVQGQEAPMAAATGVGWDGIAGGEEGDGRGTGLVDEGAGAVEGWRKKR